MKSTDTTSLESFESNAVYGEGRGLFVRGDTLMVQSFDAKTRQLKGDPLVVMSC